MPVWFTNRRSYNMKWSLILIACLFIPGSSLYAQDDPTINVNNEIVIRSLASLGAGAQNLGTSSVIFNPVKKVEGSVHLFESWRNTGVFFLPETDQKYLIRNINYNINRGVFESQVSKDTIFTFTFDFIEKIVVNSREFQNLYVPALRGNKTFEVIFENEELALLKDHYLMIREGSDNPMVMRPSRYDKQSDYKIKRGNSYKTFRMRKKDILDLLEDRSLEAEQFVREQRLSYKNDQDMKRLLTAFIGTKEE